MSPTSEQSDPALCRDTEPGEGAANVPTAAGDHTEGSGKASPRSAGSAELPEVTQWVKEAQDGNREAFELLIGHFQDRVWRRALYRIGDREEAFDVAQEVFIICFRKIGQFRGESKFWTWLCRVVDTQVINRQGWLKRRGKGRTYSLDAPMDPNEADGSSWDPPDSAADPRRRAAGNEAVDALNENLAEMSPEHREIVLLRFADGLSYEEIAETLQLTLGTVKSRINRARGELRGLMGDYLDV